jgi:hypothetical protein
LSQPTTPQREDYAQPSCGAKSVLETIQTMENS